MSRLTLNCDLGESYGAWAIGNDADIMPLIDEANVACGFHAGDPATILRTLELAVKNQVAIGAHPSYPDLVGFGRRSMKMSETDLYAAMLYQISALSGMASSVGGNIAFVKPHGALYNDMMKDVSIMDTVVQAVIDSSSEPTLVLQATAQSPQLRERYKTRRVKLRFEAFADRRYCPDGSLQDRRTPGAVLTHDEALAQVTRLLDDKSVLCTNGQPLTLEATTLCVHGDTPSALELARAIREKLNAYT